MSTFNIVTYYYSQKEKKEKHKLIEKLKLHRQIHLKLLDIKVLYKEGKKGIKSKTLKIIMTSYIFWSFQLLKMRSMMNGEGTKVENCAFGTLLVVIVFGVTITKLTVGL